MKSLRLSARATFIVASIAAPTINAQPSIAEQQDGRVIENLRQNGADVTKVHDIDFYLVFTRQSDATATAEKIRLLGYKVVDIKQTSNAMQWEVHATRKMVPELKAMQATTRGLQALAEARGGYYDGWGTIGVK
jgi:regulator of RNase E activity RraB